MPPRYAQETGPVFFGGVWEMLMGMLRPIDKLAQTFKEGGGVAQAEYPDATYYGMDRFTAGWFENLLVQEWLPAVPAVKAALDRGIDVADVGCGRGRAVIKFVQAFPKSRIVGYDVYQPNIDRATANAQAAGVASQVKFERLDASKAIPGQYDLITTFDVIHDAVDPRGLLGRIRHALRPGGTYLCLDINCSDKPEENTGPLASLFYGFSMVYCMTTSLANGGEGLAPVGYPSRSSASSPSRPGSAACENCHWKTRSTISTRSSCKAIGLEGPRPGAPTRRWRRSAHAEGRTAHLPR
jgi:2-polyprenyl-3-methyl-5-hydroxy-6-metoxy-1,4-benzoquinol methylase